MKRFIVILMLTCGICLPLAAKAIHLLYMGDTIDTKVKKSAKSDLINVEKSFAYIASACKIPLYCKKLASSDLLYENIETWLKTTQIAKDDVVVLYYSGHGGRTKKSPTIWPFGCFYKKQIVEFSTVIDKLLAKRAALNIVLLDCCNDFVGIAKRTLVIREFNLELDNLNPEHISKGIDQLFFKNFGLIVCSSSVPGQLSWVKDAGKGGYFTCHFLKRLFREAQKTNPQWDQIFLKTKSRVALETKVDLSTRQKLQYKMLLSPHPKGLNTYKKFLYNDCKHVKSKDLGQEEEEVRCFCGAYIDKAKETLETNPTSEKVKTELTSIIEEIIEPVTEKLDF